MRLMNEPEKDSTRELLRLFRRAKALGPANTARAYRCDIEEGVSVWHFIAAGIFPQLECDEFWKNLGSVPPQQLRRDLWETAWKGTSLGSLCSGLAEGRGLEAADLEPLIVGRSPAEISALFGYAFPTKPNQIWLGGSERENPLLETPNSILEVADWAEKLASQLPP